MSQPPLLDIHTDGASRGNPGAAAYAYTITRAGHDDIEEADCLGRMTNNQAEYIAVIRALEHVLEELGNDFRVIVHSDSELMVKQVSGEYRVKNEELRSLYEEARKLCERFKGGVRLVHVRRAVSWKAATTDSRVFAGDGLRRPRAADSFADHIFHRVDLGVAERI